MFSNDLFCAPRVPRANPGKLRKGSNGPKIYAQLQTSADSEKLDAWKHYVLIHKTMDALMNMIHIAKRLRQQDTSGL